MEESVGRGEIERGHVRRIKHLLDLAKDARVPKKRAGYIEIDEFKNSDLRKGYFRKACVYFLDLQGGKCAIVKSQGEDCNGKFSKVIAPYGYCSLWAPNKSIVKKRNPSKSTSPLHLKSREERGPRLVRHTVARVGDIPIGEMKGVEIEGKRVLVANVDGKFYAIGAVCTHMGGRLDKGSLDGNVVTCPRHGSKWDVRTGKLVQFSRQLHDEPIFPILLVGDEICIEFGEDSR